MNDQHNKVGSAKEGIFFGPIFSASLAHKNILLGMIGACLYGGLILFSSVVLFLSSGLLTGNLDLGIARGPFIGSLIGLTIEALFCFTLGFFIYRGSHVAAIIALVCFAIEKILLHPPGFGIGHVVFSIFIIVLLAYGVRGTLALKKIREAPRFQ
jgi:hypothetical protein